MVGILEGGSLVANLGADILVQGTPDIRLVGRDREDFLLVVPRFQTESTLSLHRRAQAQRNYQMHSLPAPTNLKSAIKKRFGKTFEVESICSMDGILL